MFYVHFFTLSFQLPLCMSRAQPPCPCWWHFRHSVAARGWWPQHRKNCAHFGL